MSSSSDSESDEDLMIALACDEIKKQKARFWVHNINLKRETYGEFYHLFPDLLGDEEKFFKYFRMSSAKFYELIQLLSLRKQDTNYRKAISPEERLAVTLKFLGYGDSFSTISFSYRLGETTVREIIYDTCEKIWDSLAPLAMPTPTLEQWQKVEEGFRTKWNYPNCVGAIDGKHIVFEKPPNSGSLFYNYKKEFSIVLLALLDADYRFITVDVGAFGRNSDGGIFRSSQLGKKLLAKELNLPTEKALPQTDIVLPHVIVGDEAFPLLPNVMRPYPGTQTSNNEANRIYNYRHCRARRVSENGFGIMAKKFRIFFKKFNISPDHLDIITLACTALHNFLRNDSCAWQPGELETEEVPEGLDNLVHVGGNFQREAFNIREQFKQYFVSNQGSVAWQREKINAGRHVYEG